MPKSRLFLSLLSLLSSSSSIFGKEIVEEVEYGVDYSFPMHRHKISINSTNIFSSNNDRQTVYDEYLQGCRDKYPDHAGICEDTEEGRIDMNFNQPQSMQNYTDIGFKKIKTPDKVWKLLLDFWNDNDPTFDIHGPGSKPEKWNKGNTYANHWSSPTYMVSVEDRTLNGGGYVLKDAIWAAAKETLEEWTGEELQPCSLYGIRVYTEGSILATHVDRLPLVSSAIVNVAQDVDEPWPIEVIGHDGRAHNITMEPGDMVLYESHSILHGRPFALKGRYFANVFIHFEPTGHTKRHNKKMSQGGDDAEYDEHESTKPKDSKLPPYIVEGTQAAEKWLKNQHEDQKQKSAVQEFTNGATEAHLAAMESRPEDLLSIVSIRNQLVHAGDANGWTPLHEAARSGSVEAVKILIDHGADVNVKTKNGATPLFLASEEYHDEEHPVVKILEELGGLFEGPEL